MSSSRSYYFVYAGDSLQPPGPTGFKGKDVEFMGFGSLHDCEWCIGEQGYTTLKINPSKVVYGIVFRGLTKEEENSLQDLHKRIGYRSMTVSVFTFPIGKISPGMRDMKVFIGKTPMKGHCPPRIDEIKRIKAGIRFFQKQGMGDRVKTVIDDYYNKCIEPIIEGAYFFAYGGDLLPTALMERIGVTNVNVTKHIVGPASVKGWKWIIGKYGYPTLSKAKEKDVVYGIIYCLTNSERERLNEFYWKIEYVRENIVAKFGPAENIGLFTFVEDNPKSNLKSPVIFDECHRLNSAIEFIRYHNWNNGEIPLAYINDIQTKTNAKYFFAYGGSFPNCRIRFEDRIGNASVKLWKLIRKGRHPNLIPTDNKKGTVYGAVFSFTEAEALSITELCYEIGYTIRPIRAAMECNWKMGLVDLWTFVRYEHENYRPSNVFVSSSILSGSSMDNVIKDVFKSMVPYFAYGGDLSRKTMGQRCPNCIFQGPASARGWKWIIGKKSGHANIISQRPSAENIIHGFVYILTSAHAKSLKDSYEKIGYKQTDIVSERNGGHRQMITYLDDSNGNRESGRVSGDEGWRIEEGLKDGKSYFPEAWIKTVWSQLVQ